MSFADGDRRGFALYSLTLTKRQHNEVRHEGDWRSFGIA